MDVNLAHDNEAVAGNRAFSVRDRDRGRSFDVLARLVEGKADGQWISEILASADGWIEIKVSNSNGRSVDVPRIAKYLMQVLPLGDAGLEFVDHAQEWGLDRLDQLCRVLEDPARHAPVFVAAIGAEADLHAPFLTKVNLWARQTYGLAQVVALRPDAVVEANRRLGVHAIEPWSIRTFLPGVALGDEADARRHRYLTTRSLALWNDRRIQQLLGDIARGAASDRPIPGDVLKLHRVFARLENRSLVDALARDAIASIGVDPEVRTSTTTDVVPEESPESRAIPYEDYRQMVALVRRVLRIDSVDEASLQRVMELASAPRPDPTAVSQLRDRVDVLQSRSDEVEDDLRVIRSEYDGALLDLAIAEQEAQDARNEIRWLRSKLRADGDFVAASEPAPREEYPACMVDLVNRLGDDGPIRFTGDPGRLEEVDDRDGLGHCVRVAWEAVQVLSDVVRARSEHRFSGSVHEYLRSVPEGFRGMTPGKHAQGETGITKRNFGSSRFFPVPTAVDPSGRKQMLAHFKLGRIGQVSPRMYYYDDAVSGQIYIGYIGLHLTNTMTD